MSDRIRRVKKKNQLAEIAALTLSAALVLISSIAFGQTSQRPKPQSEPARSKESKKLFRLNCVKCHGKDGTGATTRGEILGAADFTDEEWQKKVEDQRLLNSITHGRGQMPSFGKKLSQEQIKSLVNYVRAFQRDLHSQPE